MLAIGDSAKPIWIPILSNSRVRDGRANRVGGVLIIAGQHRHPNDVDAEPCTGRRLEDRFFHPTGGINTACSGWGQDEDESAPVSIGIEPILNR